MKRVKEYGDWCLMCPNESPGLADCWGEEFENLYMRYEAEGKYRKKVKAQDLWKAIVESQIETGTPYMLYKDACNRKTNHQNLGTIKCSNLCTEIVEYSSPDEVNYNLTKYYKYLHTLLVLLLSIKNLWIRQAPCTTNAKIFSTL